MTRRAVVDRILDRTSDFSPEDRAILLGIAVVESGLNPDAANSKSSASGLFQFIDATARAHGLTEDIKWDVDAQIRAMRRAFTEYLQHPLPKAPNERAIRLYALHHDGPTLSSGGASIARSRVLPQLPLLRELVAAYQRRAL